MRNPRRQATLRAISTLATEAKFRALVLEREAYAKGDTEERKRQRREWARWDARDDQARRLLVRADLAPAERRMRDEDDEAERADQAIFGRRPGELEVQPWEFREEG